MQSVILAVLAYDWGLQSIAAEVNGIASWSAALSQPIAKSPQDSGILPASSITILPSGLRAKLSDFSQTFRQE